MNTMTPDEWNEKYPTGTLVLVTKDDGRKVKTITRSEAGTEINGHAVIMLKGIVGFYLLSRVEHLEPDPLTQQAKDASIKQGYVSVSYLQRAMRIGYTRAASLVDQLIAERFCKSDYAKDGTPHYDIINMEKA